MSAITALHGSPHSPAPTEAEVASRPADPAETGPDARAPAPPPKIDRQTAERARDELQQAINAYGKAPRDIAMRYEESQDVYVIEVREQESGDLILQYPPEKILNVRARMDELIGAMFDRKI